MSSNQSQIENYNKNDNSRHIAKIAFAFIAFVVIASGYVKQILPCQTQKFMIQNIMAKHYIGILICFLFIMLEGGWSFDMETQEKYSVDWSNGNVIDSLVFGVILYIGILLTSKMKVTPNLMLYSMLFIVYLVNTQRLYWYNRDLIEEDTNQKIIIATKMLIFLSCLIFLYGIINYYLYQKKSYGKKFRFHTREK